MIYCPKCGTQLRDGVKNCVACGESLVPENLGSVRPLQGVVSPNMLASSEDTMPDVSVGVVQDSNYISPLDDFSCFAGGSSAKDDAADTSMPEIGMPSVGAPAPASNQSKKDDEFASMPSLDIFSNK